MSVRLSLRAFFGKQRGRARRLQAREWTFSVNVRTHRRATRHNVDRLHHETGSALAHAAYGDHHSELCVCLADTSSIRQDCRFWLLPFVNEVNGYGHGHDGHDRLCSRTERNVLLKYMLLLYDNEDWWNTITPEEMEKTMEAHNAFARYLQQKGIGLLGGEALQASANATTLRRDGDDMLVSDGPYAELKEHLGGFYIIEAKDLDEALDAARHCPLGSGTEVRPVVEFPAES